MNLDTHLRHISGIGYIHGRRLAEINLLTVSDLINHFPFRYDDFSEIVQINEAQLNSKVTLKGEIWSIKNIFTRYGKKLTQAIFNDGTNSINLTWFNSTYLAKSIKVGDKLQISGKLTKYGSKLSIIMPVWEKIPDVSSYSTPRAGRNNESLHTGGLIAVYPETEGISSKWLRTKISQILPKAELFIEDPLPEEIRNGMIPLKEAYQKIHSPEDFKDVQDATERLSFDEIFWIQLKTLIVKNNWQNKPSIGKWTIDNGQLTNFLNSLSFQLTQAQQKVLKEILKDLQKGIAMNRLVQGEVGSGKTVVAAIVAYIAHLNGFKTLYMAPTEILAFQHYSTFKKLLEPFKIEVGLYTGSRKFTRVSQVSRVPKVPRGEKTKSGIEPRDTLDTLGTRDTPAIIIGTHALLSDKLIASDVGLVIIDEQQRFGVEQRAILRNKAKIPHFLTMTATPIPRTVALTLYGDLDLSIIDELPKGRIPVKTHVVPSKKRPDAYKFIEQRVKEGEQIYIITPLIEISETLKTVKAATDEFEKLKKVFAKLKLGLLHGRLKPKEKAQILQDFKNRLIDILVSTSVVEVGVDVSNATIMVIEGAERFGLSQLHQLRGRVGRGNRQSYCLIFPSSEESGIISRLKNLERISDGLKLSEIDLKIRGSGEIFGKRQSGRFDLKIASFSNLELIEKTRLAAQKILSGDPSLAKYPRLRVKLSSFEKVAPD
ncbi:ATP-dependent DNA helicase RecG [Candidatus Daviesbacteria bacterium]|nr:ATP-dependent DNA helicase RecG [Candidatus Daviesbacteria bacterium]